MIATIHVFNFVLIFAMNEVIQLLFSESFINTR